jgi:protein-disulfide isomerase
VKLAIVNGQTVTTTDIDPQVGEAVERLDERLAEARDQVLGMEINTLLLDAEAKKRNLTTQQLFDLEVTRRVTEPTEAEVRKFIDENQSQLEGFEPAAARAQVSTFLKTQREEKLTGDFVKKLRSSTPIVMGANLNSPNLSPATVVATVGGRQLTAGMVGERLKPIIYNLRLSAYEVARIALDRVVTDLLLIAESNRRNIPPEEIVRAEVTSKLREPSEAEIVKFYEENKSGINAELNAVRPRLVTFLQEQEQQRLENAMAERLRKGADVKLLLAEPEPPRQAVSVDDDPFRGESNAPVTIVEFTDFQCSACAAMQPILDETLKSYGNRVRFVVRDFPLSIHANAMKAAEAANAAHAQGKFFEYTALLFKRQNALDVASLKKYATELGLDRTRFDAALDKGTYQSEVTKDISEGQVYGVDSTPAIFINGVRLTRLSEEALRKAIDSALIAAPPK